MSALAGTAHAGSSSNVARAFKACKPQHVQTCRRALIRALDANAWQRKQTARATLARWPGDGTAAIILACHRKHVSDAACASYLAVSWCESHRNPSSMNSSGHGGLFQLSERHRSDPITRVLGWDDPYANALHTVIYVLAHGWGEWECKPDGSVVQL